MECNIAFDSELIVTCSQPAGNPLPEARRKQVTFCHQCGGSLADNARFCPACGALKGSQSGPIVPAQPTLPAAQGAPQTESMAIVSLVLGILSLTVFHFLAGIPAIIVGRSARAKIRAYPQQLTGEGMATAGIVMGWISVVIICVVIVLIGIFFIALASH